MKDFEANDYKVFDLFRRRWALVTAGNMEHFNSCTVGWGSLGTLWTRPGKSGSVVTVYLHPARYTNDLMRESELFTVTFFPAEYKKALGVMGTLSGRDGDKAAAAGLTPVSAGGTVGYAEAELTFVCRTLYRHQMAKEDLAPDVQAYYAGNPKSFPVDENGDWQPHWVYVGEIVDVIERS